MTPARSPCLMPSSDISARMPPSPSLSARIIDRDVFDRRGDDQRPNDERQHAERDLGRRCAAGPLERRLERVERARADIAVDDAERAQRHRGEAAVAMWDAGLGFGRGCRAGHGLCGPPEKGIAAIIPGDRGCRPGLGGPAAGTVIADMDLTYTHNEYIYCAYK